MRSTILSGIMTVFFMTNLYAQTGGIECAVNMRKNAGPGVDRNLLQQRIAELDQRASLPYTMRIQVVVFYKNTPTVTNAQILSNIASMANFYRPQNICFVLSDIEYVRDSAMADFHINNESMLLSYTRPSYISIFLHTSLNSDQGTLNGNAYAIPNTYLSVVDDAIASTTNLSTMAHEMGHCLALYHTFETYYGVENVARSGECKNCDTKGDFLCDTRADLNLPESSISTACQYSGTLTSFCDQSAYLMEPSNIMTYGRRSCRNNFTNGQGGRMRDHILTETMLFNCIAPDIITIAQATNYTGGIYSLTAKDLINITSTSYNISGSAQMRMTSRRIRIGPGTSLRPAAASALIRLLSNPYCE